MRAIFTESLVHKTLFNTVVYGSSETRISCITWKHKIGINWNFGNKLFVLISSDSCYKKMLLESGNIPLSAETAHPNTRTWNFTQGCLATVVPKWLWYEAVWIESILEHILIANIDPSPTFDQYLHWHLKHVNIKKRKSCIRDERS